MRLLAATIKNFRSFKREQRFLFPSGPGLYFMQGLNEVEPRLGGNGVGKTTLWEALTWCLYGKTSRGLKAGDVCNWEAEKGTEVSFDFVLDDQLGCVWTIRRTWGPISWTLSHVAEFVTDEEVVDLTKDKTNPVLAWLRLEFEPFLHTVLMAQGRPMFLDLKQEPQAALFSDVLGLERWMEYSSRASKKASDQDGKSRDLERRLAQLQGELSAISTKDLSKSHDDWEVENLRKLLVLKTEHDDGLARRKKAKTVLLEAEEAETNARSLVAKSQPDAGLLKDLGAFRGYVADYSQMLRDAQRDFRVAEQQTIQLSERKNCPECGQSLGRDDFAAQVHRTAKKLDHAGKEIKRWTRELEASHERLEGLERQERAAVDALDDARAMLAQAQGDVSAARRALAELDRELDRIEDRSDELERAENPYARMAQQARQDASRLREEVRQCQGRLDDSQARYGLLSYWVRGFKEIRLQEIAEALTELEIEVNSAVTALGLIGWELNFQVDREGKGGGIQRGFSVMVRSPHNPRPTPWEAWSGGESQRLRLAANMGLADLIRSRTGAALNMEVWDEPTNGLSPEGIQDLLESLETRARDEGRQIWIVDHKTFDFGGFAGTATVVKAPSGARVRTTW